MPGTPRKATKATNATPKYTLGSRGREALFDLELPSGETCQVRRPGVQGLIAAGVLDSFDQLTSFVHTKHIEPHQRPAKGASVSKEAVDELARDPNKMAAGFQLIDRLVVHVVNQPRCWIDYQMIGESAEDFAKRQAAAGDAVPIRDVDLGDKLFIVQWAVGGSADLKAFREQLGGALDALAAGESVPESTQ